jgi:hypothetical protein
MIMKNKGTITLAFICCREVMPDPEFYAECIGASYEELRDACVSPKKKVSGRKAGKKKSTSKKFTEKRAA